MKNVSGLKKSALAVAVVVAGMAPAISMAELTGNVGAATNYVWRGVTQTNDGPSISGGVDYAHESGLYAGTWLGNVDFGDGSEATAEYEQDLYLGFGGGEDFTYDVGYIYYDYPLAEGADFGEIYASVGFSYFSAGVAYTVNSEIDEDDESAFSKGDLYYSASFAYPLTEELELSIGAGYYDFDDDGDVVESYGHYNAYLSKGDFAFGVEVADVDGEFPAGKGANDPRFVVAWSTSFDLM